MDIRLIQVPYDSGSYNKRMGAGPFYFIKSGLVKTLKEKGYSIEEFVIETKETFTMEVKKRNKSSLSLIFYDKIIWPNGHRSIIFLATQCISSDTERRKFYE